MIELPAGNETPVSSMLPEPWAVKPEAPSVAVAYHLSLLKLLVRFGSVIVAPDRLPGPALLTTTV